MHLNAEARIASFGRLAKPKLTDERKNSSCGILAPFRPSDRALDARTSSPLRDPPLEGLSGCAGDCSANSRGAGDKSTREASSSLPKLGAKSALQLRVPRCTKLKWRRRRKCSRSRSARVHLLDSSGTRSAQGLRRVRGKFRATLDLSLLVTLNTTSLNITVHD